MNLKDKCKEDGISLAEGKIKYGLSHWNKQVPDVFEERADEPVVEIEVIKAVINKTPTTPKPLKKKERKLGFKALLKAKRSKKRAIYIAGLTKEARAEQLKTTDLELIKNSVNGLGTKSPYWNLRHLTGRD